MPKTATNTGEQKVRRTPEEKAARKAERAERLEAMTPEERAAHEKKRAERKAAKGKA